MEIKPRGGVAFGPWVGGLFLAAKPSYITGSDKEMAMEAGLLYLDHPASRSGHHSFWIQLWF